MNDVVKKQERFDKIISNIIQKQTNVQGYILYGNGKENLSKYATLLTKVLVCKKSYYTGCNKCNVCSRIDNGDYTELKIINPVNGTIKKEEIVDLKNQFSTSPIEGNNLVYIINDAELLNPSSANSILKFLEEPDGNIVGIFTTSNINLMYDTIISRCQVIRLNNEIDDIDNLNTDDFNYLVSYIQKLEENYIDAFTELKEKFLKKFDNRKSVSNALNMILLFYKECLDYKLFKKSKKFSDNINLIQKISSQDISKITGKISFILENIRKIDYNVNIQLFMANFVIGMGELKNG